jgi:tetratricopeptide (TPR) repeat protein
MLLKMSLRTVALGTCLTMPLAAVAQEHSHLAGADAKLGSVHFATSCTAKSQPQFDRAVALLHSFEFGSAISAFDAALATDPDCAMAHWGIALSRWGNPFAAGLKPAAALQQGRSAIEHARAAKPKSQRERDYIDAAANLYDRFETVSQQNRVNAYSDAMAKVAARYATDTEASIFYALSLSMSADLADKTYARQLKAGAILERLFARQPQHPGLAHYIIHSYDSPSLAPRALNAARSYAKIAPDAPHALHMPSHIFTRVGSWEESIETNIASAAAAKREGSIPEQLHASDYLVYAYLQSGRDAEAAAVVQSAAKTVAGLNANAPQTGAAPPSAGFFATAAIPARYVLERGDWSAAAKIEPRSTTIPYADAISWFARGLGAARLGDIPKARDAAKALDEIRLKLAQAGEPYWSLQVEIQEINVLAWTSFAEKDTDYALTRMRAAVAKEDGTEKSAVTPGPLAPARELLGEMLLQLNRPADALKEFEATLAREPNRFRALYGAAHAAKLAGNEAAARRYSGELLKICSKADQPGRGELADARVMLGLGGTGK